MQRYLMKVDLGSVPVSETDVLVIGTGVAGLFTALHCQKFGRVTILTKQGLQDCNTALAQGGIAAALSATDSPQRHLEDTLLAGDGLCDERAVQVLVEEGPACVMDLVRMGVQFDLGTAGYALTREGAHSVARILHAREDATGAEISDKLVRQVALAGIPTMEHHLTVDLLTVDGRCCGALALDGYGQLRAFLAGATVLCTGGAGQLYAHSTNPSVATGDGIAMAFRAGADVMDMEFMQFHPTALYDEGGSRFLISEAMRGEGALLLNASLERFMPSYHPAGELASRDVVARAIFDQMRVSGVPYVWLDARGIQGVVERFPTIAAGCRERGIDISRDLIPVSPAAHYMMGGVRTDPDGCTTVPGLYACGEVACTGVHGGNRLASNSLLEGLVFGRRAAEHIRVRAARAGALPSAVYMLSHSPESAATDPALVPILRNEVQQLMWDKVGIVRDQHGLTEALHRLENLSAHLLSGVATAAEVELANMVTVAELVTRAALTRTESRGGHFRSDFPQRDDDSWRKHLSQRFRPQEVAPTVVR